MSGNWVLVTGASRGIGRKIVQTLSDSTNIVFTGRCPESIKQTKELCTNSRFLVTGYVCDNNSEDDIKTLSDKLINTYGAPLGIVHNAGITKDSIHINQTSDDWLAVLDTNLVSVFRWHKYLLPSMMYNGDGSIIFMSSVSAIIGNPGQTIYSSSKAALHGLTKSLAHEVGRFGIRVNCIVPGLIKSEMVEEIPKVKLIFLQEKILLRRLGEQQDVANLVEFLLSHK
ncbi:SDR family oxidoreductase, partial [Escherichia coli]|uniref:SDR family oxidoreductase n=1 Tax=Escherichia coli TaxID=562 RepID=UPI0022F33AA5